MEHQPLYGVWELTLRCNAKCLHCGSSTDKNTRKVKNIKENPNVAYTVYDHTDQFDELRYVQVEGHASVLTDEKTNKEIHKLLNKKFPSMSDIPINSDSVVIKITPKTCYYSDYNKRFGNRETVKF